MNKDAHPLSDLKELLGRPGHRFEFSFYSYIPDSLDDQRRLAWIEGGDGALDQAWGLWNDLREGEELSMHSTVWLHGRRMHIPMIDGSCARLGPKGYSRLKKFIDPKWFSGMRFYQSGRSFHAYGSELMEEPSLASFLGSALLANEVGADPVVDARWIGHRLMGGRASLRLSANASRSLMSPERFDPLSVED